MPYFCTLILGIHDFVAAIQLVKFTQRGKRPDNNYSEISRISHSITYEHIKKEIAEETSMEYEVL
jgi:hypothetical protein